MTRHNAISAAGFAALFAALLLACGGVQKGAPARGEKSRAADGPAVPEGAFSPRLQLSRGRLSAGKEMTGLLEVMSKELELSMKALGSGDEPPPYYLAYEVHDDREVRITASFGGLQASDDRRIRHLDVDLRVGSHRLDNTHQLRGDAHGYRGGAREHIHLPLVDDPLSLQAVIWKATDDAWRQGVEQLVRVKANKQVNVEEEDDSDDFSREEPVRHISAAAALQFDIGPLEKRARRWSRRFTAYPDIHESEVVITVTESTRYIATSEGTLLQIPRTWARLTVSGSTTAEDGMQLGRFESVDVPDPGALPTDAEFDRVVQEVIDDLLALRQAPITDPFVGPAILDGRAAGVYFHEIFGHRAEGHRQKDESEGQTFAKKIGESIMPVFLDVYDDPSVSRINGIDLAGYYPFDNEGVRAHKAELVKRGVFSGFLMSRSPTRGFERSNGHGRRSNSHSVVARQANLIVHPEYVVTREQLTEQLRAEVSRQKKPYGLRFTDVSGGYTTTSRRMTQAFKVQPVMVYRVYPDGREELVRGVDLEGTPLTSLSTILAAADDFQVFNGICGAESGYIPVSAVSPSLLLSQIEIARREKEQGRPPLLPAPPLAAGEAKGGE